MTITDTEWAVMELVWARPGVKGREFVEWFSASRGWSRSTTLTLLRRLEQKGAVQSSALEGAKRYYPLISRDEAALCETDSFIKRVYHGSLSQLVSTFTSRQTLSKEEIEELSAMLRDMEEKRDA